jgi:hypothetical protein
MNPQTTNTNAKAQIGGCEVKMGTTTANPSAWITTATHPGAEENL